MNKYIVIKSIEWFKRTATNKYQYQHLQDTDDRWFFDSEKKAKQFMNSYELRIESTNFDVYLDALDLYEYDEDNDDILENSELIYSVSTDIDAFNKKNIKKLVY